MRRHLPAQGQLAKSLQVTSRLIADLESNKILLRNRETKSRIHKIVVDCNRFPWSLSATQIAQMRTSATAHAWAMLQKTTNHAILRKIIKGIGKLRPKIAYSRQDHKTGRRRHRYELAVLALTRKLTVCLRSHAFTSVEMAGVEPAISCPPDRRLTIRPSLWYQW